MAAIENYHLDMSSTSTSSNLEVVTGKALEADKKAKAAKEKARAAKAKLKNARKLFKSAKRDVKAARKMARKALKDAARARDALQTCLAKIAKQKSKAGKRKALDKASQAAAQSLAGDHALRNGAKRNDKRKTSPARKRAAAPKTELGGTAPPSNALPDLA